MGKSPQQWQTEAGDIVGDQDEGLDLVCQGIILQISTCPAAPVCAVTLQPCWNVANHASFHATTLE